MYPLVTNLLMNIQIAIYIISDAHTVAMDTVIVNLPHSNIIQKIFRKRQSEYIPFGKISHDFVLNEWQYLPSPLAQTMSASVQIQYYQSLDTLGNGQQHHTIIGAAHAFWRPHDMGDTTIVDFLKIRPQRVTILRPHQAYPRSPKNQISMVFQE